MKDLAIFERQPDSSFKIRFPRNSIILENAEIYYQTMLIMIGDIAAKMRNNLIRGDKDAEPIIAAQIATISNYIFKLQNENGVIGGITNVSLGRIYIDSSKNVKISINVDGNVFNLANS